MLRIKVVLLSGEPERSESLLLPQSSRIKDLRTEVQKAFQGRLVRLVTADGNLLDADKSLEAAGLRDGDVLTAILLEAKQLAATHAAFALSCCGGDQILTWGQ